jgi:chromosome segregation ATPase
LDPNWIIYGTGSRRALHTLTQREKLNNGVKDAREKLANIEKIKVEALKKTEETKHSADQEVTKMEIDIGKSKDLAIESKERLRTEISSLKREIQEKYTDLKKRISETITPSP